MSEPGSLIRSRSGRSAAPNFHLFVINELGAGIVSGKFSGGTILPRDNELMDMFGVSRTVLREALKTLEAKGLVEARPKVGTRVTHRSHWTMFDPQVLLWHIEAGFDKPFLENVFSIRRILETEAARQASLQRKADDARMMHYWVQQMSISRGLEVPFAQANLELHRLLLEASRNPFFRSTLGVIEFTLAAAISDRDRDDGTSVYYEKQLSAQRALVDAVEKGAPDLAASTLNRILDLELERATGSLP